MVGYAKRWRMIPLQELAKEPVIFIRDEAWQGLRFDDGGNDHLGQPLIQHLYPGAERKTSQRSHQSNLRCIVAIGLEKRQTIHLG